MASLCALISPRIIVRNADLARCSLYRSNIKHHSLPRLKLNLFISKTYTIHKPTRNPEHHNTKHTTHQATYNTPTTSSIKEPSHSNDRMYIPKDAIVAGLLGLAKYVSPLVASPVSNSNSHCSRVSSGMPTTNTSTPALPDSINSTVPVINSTAPVIVPELVNGTEPVFTNDTHGIANDTDVIVNDTQLMSWLSAPKQKHHSLFKRGLPPRDRKLADHMENYGENLPECYKKCMRSEDGKSSIHMGQVC